MQMRELSLLVAALVFSAALALRGSTASAPRETRSGTSAAGQLAPTPPMGWNSWDSYGTSIDEKQFRANADFMAQHLKQFGWQYVVIDEGWYLVNPSEESSKEERFSLDEFGRYAPDVARFPSAANGAGFKPLADYIHSLGLKFGIHILRGIPKVAVRQNLAVADSKFHAADAADQSDLCPWNDFNFGADPRRGGQAYYDSLAKLYAGWGVDFVKVDCVASRPYKDDEVRIIGTAFQNATRWIVISLSPGEAPIDKIADLRRYSNLWRISDDIWDVWHSTADFPQGVRDQFVRAAKWSALAQPDHWPDADMLPIGNLRPSPGWGKPRETRLTHDEERTLMTLWCIFRSPLMMGGDLTSADDWTLSLLTNPEIIAVDQHSTANRAVISSDNEAVWIARAEGGSDFYVGVFNLADKAQTITHEWRDVSLASSEYNLRDLWSGKDLGLAGSLRVTLAPHASVLYRITPTSGK